MIRVERTNGLECGEFRSAGFRRFLPFESLPHAVGQVQQLDAFLNVGLVGGLVRRDVAKKAVLFRATLGRLAVEKTRCRSGRRACPGTSCDAVLEVAVFGLEPRDGFVVERVLVAPDSVSARSAPLLVRGAFCRLHCTDIRTSGPAIHAAVNRRATMPGAPSVAGTRKSTRYKS